MTGLISFSLDQTGLESAAFLLERKALPSNGDLECDFLYGIQRLKRHAPNAPTGCVAKELAQTAETVVIVRNPDVVLDRLLLRSLRDTVEVVAALGAWALAGAGGLGTQERRHIALYASQNPTIPENAGLQPVLDMMPDLYVVDARFLRSLHDEFLVNLEHALEPALIVEGYLQGRISVFAPTLTAGINGERLSRDFTKVSSELQNAFCTRLTQQSIQTLSGPVMLEESPDRCESTARTIDLASTIHAEIVARSDAPTLSIVTRTRFDRMHLLRRMLTSVSRARSDDVGLEIVLSTDAEASFANISFAKLQAEFVNLRLTLCVNEPSGHSRVTNLTGGVYTATGDYLMFLDDDDYLDLFAFQIIRAATFAGNRPVIALTSEVQEETWEKTPSGRWILSCSTHTHVYPASGWRQMFTGVNKLPICGLLFSTQRLQVRLNSMPLHHDLSEDYALFLLMLTDPELPAVFECPEPAVHISIRGSENSVLMPDRRPWVRDITRFLADLTKTNTTTGAGQWMLLKQTPSGPRSASSDERDAVTQLQRQLKRRDEEIKLLQQKLEHLRHVTPALQEAAA